MNFWIRPATNRKSIFVFGKEDTLNNAMSEPAELIQAVEKIRRAQANGEDLTATREHLTEEMADTILVIINLMEIFNIGRIDLNRWLNIKQCRQEERTREKTNEPDTYYPG